MKKSFRKQNITGIKRLSIGATKNAKGNILKRYSAGFKDNTGKWKCKTFYFGDHKAQYDAYLDACRFLEKIGELVIADIDIEEIYRSHKHELL